jgi:hypothetical protein
MRNPALAGLLTYRDDIVHGEDGEPLRGVWAILPELTWRAVRALLDDPARKPPRGVRTLLGGLARCVCGNVITGSRSYQGNAVYRCQPATRSGPGPHTAIRADLVDTWVGGGQYAGKELPGMVVDRLSRPDVADLITPPPHVDTAALRTEAATIRRNLDAMAADAVVAGYSRSMLSAATERGNARLAEIAAQLAESAGSSALAPFAAMNDALKVWRGLELARKRAVIKALGTITLHPAGRGARVPDLERVVDFRPKVPDHTATVH